MHFYFTHFQGLDIFYDPISQWYYVDGEESPFETLQDCKEWILIGVNPELN